MTDANALIHQYLLTVDLEETNFDTEMGWPPKCLCSIAMRSASLPTAGVTVRSQRAERQGRRKCEREKLDKASRGVGRMQFQNFQLLMTR